MVDDGRVYLTSLSIKILLSADKNSASDLWWLISDLPSQIRGWRVHDKLRDGGPRHLPHWTSLISSSSSKCAVLRRRSV